MMPKNVKAVGGFYEKQKRYNFSACKYAAIIVISLVLSKTAV